MNTWNQMKIVVEHSAAGHDAFADVYRFGPASDSGAPLVVYFGGAISNWDALLLEQGNERPDFDETDLVWRTTAGCGECVGSAAWGGNLHVRFHHHKSANKFCSEYYLNVSKARAWSGEIARRFAALAGT